MAELGVGFHHRVAQRLDHLGFDLIAQMPPGLRGGHAAPAVDDLLFLGLRVVDAGKGADILGKDPRQLARRGFALGTVRVRQQVEHAFDIEVFALHLELKPGDGFVEQTFPGIAHDSQIMQKTLHLVRQLIGLHRADPVEHGLVARQIGVAGHQLFKVIVRQPVQFEAEENQRRGEVGDLFLHVGHELRPPAIRRQLVVAQPGKGHDPPGDVIDLFVAQNAFEQPVRIKLGQLAFVVACEGGAGFFEPIEIAFQFRRVLAPVEVI